MALNRFYGIYQVADAEMSALDPEKLLCLIEQMPQFSPTLNPIVREVPTSSLYPLCTSVSRQRLLQVNNIIDIYQKSNIRPFYPARLEYGEMEQVLFPPVVTRDYASDALVLLDGMHRVYAAAKRGYSAVYILEVTESGGAFPGDRVEWAEVYEATEHIPGALKFKNFRPLESRVLYTVTLNAEWLWRPSKKHST